MASFALPETTQKVQVAGIRTLTGSLDGLETTMCGAAVLLTFVSQDFGF